MRRSTASGERRADDGGEVADILGDEEIGLHEALDRRLPAAPGISDRVGDLPLQVEGEPLLGSPGDEMHPAAHAPQELLRALEHQQFLAVEQPGRDELPHIVDAVGVFRDPEQRVEVAQAALAVLDVGLDQIARGAGPPDAGLALGELRLREGRGRTLDHLGAEAPQHVVEDECVAGDEAGLQQRRADRHVGARLAHAVVDRADGVADLQLEIPERVEHRLDAALAPGGLLVREEEEQVDIRARRQRAAAITADGHDRDPLGLRRVDRRVEMLGRRDMQAADDRIHHRGKMPRADQPMARPLQQFARGGMALVEDLA